MEFKYLNDDNQQISEVAIKYYKNEIYNKFVIKGPFSYKVFNNPKEYLNFYGM